MTTGRINQVTIIPPNNFFEKYIRGQTFIPLLGIESPELDNVITLICWTKNS